MAVISVDADSKLRLSGVFVNNTATDPYGVCGSRGGVFMLRDVQGKVSVEGQFTGNNGDKHGGVLRNDRLQSGGRIDMTGDYKHNTARSGSVAQLVTMRTKSRFTFTPTSYVSGGTGDAVTVTRSKGCTNKAKPPNADITGCD